MVTKNSALVSNDGTISVVLDWQTYTVRVDHPRYGMLKQAYKDGDWDAFVGYYDGTLSPAVVDVEKSGIPGFEFSDGEFYYQGKKVAKAIVDALRVMVRDGLDIEPMKKFLTKLFNNPSFRSVEQLYGFVDRHGLTIDDEGDILCYKVVTADFKDKYTKTIDNSPGTEVKCNRNEVDDNPQVTCSNGYHAGGFSYSGPQGWYFNVGDKVVIVKIDPADVVSVPVDHNEAKMRICRYVVLQEYVNKLKIGTDTASGTPEEEHPEDLDGPEHDGSVDDELFNDEDADEYDWDEEDEFEDEEEDEEPELDEPEYVYSSIVEVAPENIIEFDYKGERRRVEVESCGAQILKGRLLKTDPSYVKGENSFRNFTKSLMDKVKILA